MPKCFSDLGKKALWPFFISHLFAFQVTVLYFFKTKVCMRAIYISGQSSLCVGSIYHPANSTIVCPCKLLSSCREKTLKFRSFSTQGGCLKQVQRKNLAQANKQTFLLQFSLEEKMPSSFYKPLRSSACKNLDDSGTCLNDTLAF